MKLIMTVQRPTLGLIVSLGVSRSLLKLSLVMMVLSTLALSSAWGHQCRFYTPDKRNLCLAQNENARFYCKFIKDADQQRYCFAYVDRTPNQCDSITEETLKTQCSNEVQIRFDEAEAKRKAAEEERKAEEARKAAADAAANQGRSAPPQSQGSGR